MKLNRAEKARLIAIDQWLADERIAMVQLEALLSKVLGRVPPSGLETAMDHIRLPLGHLKWLLALVKREVLRS